MAKRASDSWHMTGTVFRLLAQYKTPVTRTPRHDIPRKRAGVLCCGAVLDVHKMWWRFVDVDVVVENLT